MSHLARSAGLTGFVEQALAVGLDPYRLAAEARAPAAAFTDPDLKIASRSIDRLYELAAERSGVEDFALRVAETRKLSNLGPIALVVREQPTLRKAITELSRYIWLQNDALSVHLEETGDVMVMRIGTPPWMGRQCGDLSLGVTARALRELLGETWRPQEAWFMHGPPARLDTYRRLFGATVRFNQEFPALLIDRADLERPVGQGEADPVMARQMVRYLEQIAAGRGTSFTDKVREMIVLLLPNGECTVDRVAQRLAMDRRTLHRRLSAEGATFSTLLNNARRESAEALLARSDRPFQSVAEQLGFSSLSAFAHWFRRQYDSTASDYRAQASAGPAPSLAAPAH